MIRISFLAADVGVGIGTGINSTAFIPLIPLLLSSLRIIRLLCS